MLKSYRLCVILWVGLYRPFEGAVLPFLSLLEVQILKVIITSFETRLAGVPE